jgi:cation diffusion facilitator CzcD-associated flavoprotein CzcO
MTPKSLRELEDDLARDLSTIDYPNTPWVPRRADGLLDVLIVGGGQGGLAVASKLLREQVRNILVIDENPDGHEGIWMRYARMHTLRTPKHIGGPDLGVPSLTFRAWFEAQYGAASFASIKYIAKADWQAYLAWFRKVLRIPVSNDTQFLGVTPEDGVLSVTVERLGQLDKIRTRKLVLAGGIETSGYWWTPPEIERLPKTFRAHTADLIDFNALTGKAVVVVGAGASAFDNAATALEHGASVTMLCRRADLQRIQPYKVLAFPGFLNDFASLPDAERWRSMEYLLTVREALTAETWNRVTRHLGFKLVTGAPVLAAVCHGDGVLLDTARGQFEADFVICGTGFEMDLLRRPELASVSPHIATWADRFTPPNGQINPRLGRYPYLDGGMAFTEKLPGEADWVRSVFCFNFGATMSFGPSGSSISAMKYAAPRVSSAIVGSLFREDYPVHESMIRGYDQPEFDLVFARDKAITA